LVRVFFFSSMVFLLLDSKGGSWRHAGGMSQPPWLFRRKASPAVSTKKSLEIFTISRLFSTF